MVTLDCGLGGQRSALISRDGATEEASSLRAADASFGGQRLHLPGSHLQG